MAKKATAANKPLTKAEIVDKLAEATELTKADVGSVLDGLTTLIEEQLGKKGPGIVTIPGLMKISRNWKDATKARKGINPFTKEETTFKAKPAHYTIKIKPLKGMSDMVGDIKKKLE